LVRFTADFEYVAMAKAAAAIGAIYDSKNWPGYVGVGLEKILSSTGGPFKLKIYHENKYICTLTVPEDEYEAWSAFWNVAQATGKSLVLNLGKKHCFFYKDGVVSTEIWPFAVVGEECILSRMMVSGSLLFKDGCEFFKAGFQYV
jgi:hypothetical protein